MPPPDISIVVCTYNRAASLRLTLTALAAQAVSSEVTWEVVVVDNNSTDSTRSVAQRFIAASSIPARYVFVAAQGLSRARNAGIAESRAGVVAFTDDDVSPATDWVAQIAAALEREDSDIVGGRIVPMWSREPPPWLRHRPALHAALAIMDHPSRAAILAAEQMPGVWGANMAFRRRVFDKVGVFDTRRGLVGSTLHRGEEIDLVARALAAGCRAVYDPRVVVFHRIDHQRMRLPYLSRLYFQRAEGEALVPPAAGMVPSGVSASAYTLAARAIAIWLGATARRRPDAIERWLDCCAAVGSMWGRTLLWLR
jgi:glycosyltransferase involved in cell wall biosynthesis